ncbi:hypothetical protein TcCL_ESM00346 [Trypanosoma cruzi]|nr:hypothetical protein TcCL_ESM00346 [Trypanosoma cruzi]
MQNEGSKTRIILWLVTYHDGVDEGGNRRVLRVRLGLLEASILLSYLAWVSLMCPLLLICGRKLNYVIVIERVLCASEMGGLFAPPGVSCVGDPHALPVMISHCGST